jgi:hypothetical protein
MIKILLFAELVGFDKVSYLKACAPRKKLLFALKTAFEHFVIWKLKTKIAILNFSNVKSSEE